jgi:hypothetical protein
MMARPVATRLPPSRLFFDNHLEKTPRESHAWRIAAALARRPGVAEFSITPKHAAAKSADHAW